MHDRSPNTHLISPYLSPLLAFKNKNKLFWIFYWWRGVGRWWRTTIRQSIHGYNYIKIFAFSIFRPFYRRGKNDACAGLRRVNIPGVILCQYEWILSRFHDSKDNLFLGYHEQLPLLASVVDINKISNSTWFLSRMVACICSWLFWAMPSCWRKALGVGYPSTLAVTTNVFPPMHFATAIKTVRIGQTNPKLAHVSKFLFSNVQL